MKLRLPQKRQYYAFEHVKEKKNVDFIPNMHNYFYHFLLKANPKLLTAVSI